MTREQVNISVLDEYLSSFASVVQDVEQAGVILQHRMDTLGIITGWVDSRAINKLKSIPGVAAVELVRRLGTFVQP